MKPYFSSLPVHGFQRVGLVMLLMLLPWTTTTTRILASAHVVTLVSSDTLDRPYRGGGDTTLSIGTRLGGAVSEALVQFALPDDASFVLEMAVLHLDVPNPTRGVLQGQVLPVAWDETTTYAQLEADLRDAPLDDDEAWQLAPGNEWLRPAVTFVDVTTTVQSWQQLRAANDGWRLRNPSLDQVDLRVSATQGPYLTLTYRLPHKNKEDDDKNAVVVGQLREAAPDTHLVAAATSVSVGTSLVGMATRVLLKFGDLFHLDHDDQNAQLDSVTLHVTVINPTSGNLVGHRMQVPWDTTSSWNDVAGATPGTAAAATEPSFTIVSPGSLLRPVLQVAVDVTADYQDWIDAAARGDAVNTNQGWVIVNRALNGAELALGNGGGDQEEGPYLLVTYKVGPATLGTLPPPPPTQKPTGSPTHAPSSAPTRGPMAPTGGPTRGPMAPTGGPTRGPEQAPTVGPTRPPSQVPTGGPRTEETALPTIHPTDPPKTNPPSRQPVSNKPTVKPTRVPSSKATIPPATRPPTSRPTDTPLAQPTARPTAKTTSNPTDLPTSKSTGQPTSSKPTLRPSLAPLSNPTLAPTLSPINEPGSLRFTATDTDIASGTPNVVYGNQVTVSVDESSRGGRTQGLLQFSNLSLPPDTTLVSATLTLLCSDSTSRTISFYRMLQGWSEEVSTWARLGNGVQTDNRQAQSAVSFQLQEPLNGLSYTMDVTPDVRAWLNGAAANHGWVLENSSSNGFDFWSSESGLGPVLHLYYQASGHPVAPSNSPRVTPPTASPLATALPAPPIGGGSGSLVFSAGDTEIMQGTPNMSYGNAATVGVDQWDREGRTQGLMRFFNLRHPPGTVLVSATLTLVCSNTSPGTISFFRMLTNWSESSTWNSLGWGVQTNNVQARSRASLFLYGPFRGESYTLDVTDDVRLWLNGVPNYGWLLQNDSSDGVDFWSSESAQAPVLRINYRAEGPTVSPTKCDGNSIPPIVLTGETYVPGALTVERFDMDGVKITLSTGMNGRAIAKSGYPISLADGGNSALPFHFAPDAAGVFPDAAGGFYYSSNSEMTSRTLGGVASIQFDANGNVIDYFRTLSNTHGNCGGGKTPWGTWISCEESWDGRVWQTDPTGVLPARRTALVEFDGFYESFAYWINPINIPLFYVTEDQREGPLVRFTPNAAVLACFRKPTPAERWCTLESGSYSYLRLDSGPVGTFSFGSKSVATPLLYPNAEGMDVADGILYFTSKSTRMLFALDLEAGTFVRTSTISGAFNLQPDQLKAIASDPNDIVYFCEDGGAASDVHGRNSTSGEYFTILRGDGYNTETTGLGFSDDAKFMFVSFQRPGVIWQLWRQDGETFRGPIIDIKYHNELSP